MNDRSLQHPDITAALINGYPSRQQRPRCPICGEECETVYKNSFIEIVGCDVCLESKDAWEETDCFSGKEL